MSEFMTLLDLKNSLQPGDGAIADVAEVLVEENEILNDIPWQRGNLLTGDVHFKREAMPSAEVRKINEGITSTISKKVAQTDTCIELASRSIVDMAELKLAPNASEYLALESKPHIAVLGEDFAANVFFGTDTSGVLGFATRYGQLNGPKKRQIIDAATGATGTNLSSIYIVKWDPDEVTGIYPKNSSAGLEMVPLANQLVPDKNGKLFRAHVTDYSWFVGLKVRDDRYAARVCNIDMDDVATDEAARQKLFEHLITVKNRVYHVTTGRVVIYVSPDLYSILEVAAFNKSNMALGYKDVENDTRILTFSGIPIRKNDCQLAPEKRVA
jgi:hypothetical protein